MNILSIETSTETASCALINENSVLSEITYNKGKHHSVILMNMIDHILSAQKVDISDVDGFVVSKGPGSFTGLRIGMATVKGLSFGTNKKFVSISTLDSLAFNLAYSKGIICPIMDALRNNVYTSLYKFSNNELLRIEDYMHISIEDLLKKLKSYNEPINFVGDGLKLHSEYLSNNLCEYTLPPINLNIPRASSLGEIGMKLLKNGIYDDLNSPNLIYISKPQAEREYEKRLGDFLNE